MGPKLAVLECERISFEGLAETQDADTQHQKCEARHEKHIRPKDLQAYTFEENAAQDQHHMAEWVEVTQPLEEKRHTAYGRAESGKAGHGHRKEERRNHRLLLCFRQGGKQKS